MKKKLTEIHCADCGKALTKFEINTSRHFLGMELTEFYCLDCLTDELGYDDPEEVRSMAEQAKQDGCKAYG